MTRFISIVGLGFGDCGKGRFVDELTTRLQARLIIRFNGGAQAGHTVVHPTRHHVFAQFGAGTFYPGTSTLLAAPVVVHPLGLLREAARLEELGVVDALDRLLIDERCVITTPFLQSAGRLRELARGADAHGTCGVGFGETVAFNLEQKQWSITYGDLGDLETCRARLEAQRLLLRRAFTSDLGGRAAPEIAALADPGLGARWLEAIAPLIKGVPPADRAKIAANIKATEVVIFEGAQGLLLDEDFGFHPHTTWSRVGPPAAEAVLADLGIAAKVERFGVLRVYLTRHGRGPFPTESEELAALVEPHNPSSGWQGRFRRGHPDLLLWRYAVAAAGPLDGLLVSHLDAFERRLDLRLAIAYEELEEIKRLQPSDFAGRSAQSAALARARPLFAPQPIRSATEFLTRIEDGLCLPIVLGSNGPLPGQLGFDPGRL